MKTLIKILPIALIVACQGQDPEEMLMSESSTSGGDPSGESGEMPDVGSPEMPDLGSPDVGEGTSGDPVGETGDVPETSGGSEGGDTTVEDETTPDDDRPQRCETDENTAMLYTDYSVCANTCYAAESAPCVLQQCVSACDTAYLQGMASYYESLGSDCEQAYDCADQCEADFLACSQEFCPDNAQACLTMRSNCRNSCWTQR